MPELPLETMSAWASILTALIAFALIAWLTVPKIYGWYWRRRGQWPASVSSQFVIFPRTDTDEADQYEGIWGVTITPRRWTWTPHRKVALIDINAMGRYADDSAIHERLLGSKAYLPGEELLIEREIKFQQKFTSSTPVDDVNLFVTLGYPPGEPTKIETGWTKII